MLLQDGQVAPGSQLVSSSYVVSSTSSNEYWGETVDTMCGASTQKVTGYGYQWWAYRHVAVTAQESAVDYYCAVGYRGQFICVYPSLDAVFAVASDSTAAGCALMEQVPPLLLREIRFCSDDDHDGAVATLVAAAGGGGLGLLVCGLVYWWYRKAVHRRKRRWRGEAEAGAAGGKGTPYVAPLSVVQSSAAV
jgi:hypothetical protein